MKSLLVAGVLNQPFGSFAAVSQSNDGAVWDDLVRIFDTNDSITAMDVRDGHAVIANQRGYVAITADYQTFHTNEVQSGFGISSLLWQKSDNSNHGLIATGCQVYGTSVGPYIAGDEVAQIYQATSPSSDWYMTWTHNNRYSRFYQVKEFTTFDDQTILIVVGHAGGVGDAWYSLDHGASWAQVTIPPGVGTIYSVEYYNTLDNWYWIWGCAGKIFLSLSLHDDDWQEILLTKKDIARNMLVSSNGSALVINGMHNIYWTFSINQLYSWTNNGYVFDSIQRLTTAGVDRYFVWGRSPLTQYTMWYTEDLTTWTPWNNGLHVQASAVTT